MSEQVPPHILERATGLFCCGGNHYYKDGKQVYDVLDKDGESSFKSGDYDAAKEYLKQNYDKLREYATEPKDEEDREAKLKALQDLQMNPKLKDPESVQAMMQRKKELMKEPVAAEGNEFANAVRKAKAAGMKAGDKFKVGDQEYALKDAIEMAGLQLEEFFTPEDNEPDMVVRDPEDEADDKDQEIAKDQEEAEEINTELDRIKQLANI